MTETRAGDAVLIAAISGRALAESARRGGYRPLVADFFGDQDTVAAAEAHAQVEGSFARGFGESELMAVLERLAAPHAPVGIVCGTGFEDRPQMLAPLAQRWRLYGNGAGTVARVKDPEAFAAVCRGCDVPFPAISLQPPTHDGFVAKRRGGSGGAHVANHDAAARAVRDGVYYQARVPGRPVSALLLANGLSAVVLGLSAQWVHPTSRQPFRYGGSVRPADVPPDMAGRLEKAACRLAAALSLTGLNSADFMVNGGDFWAVEINPRPGATLDIFETPRPNASLFSLHIAACAGDLIDEAPRLDGARASAICYAARDVTAPERFAWPDWSSDRPNGGLAIKAGEPLCTVHAGAATAADARALADERLALVDAWTRGWTQDGRAAGHEQHG
jgi:predicted ATP-grasp superfamily ATP-dependent carboligase